jgi:hypothetical protein
LIFFLLSTAPIVPTMTAAPPTPITTQGHGERRAFSLGSGEKIGPLVGPVGDVAPPTLGTGAAAAAASSSAIFFLSTSMRRLICSFSPLFGSRARNVSSETTACRLRPANS